MRRTRARARGTALCLTVALLGAADTARAAPQDWPALYNFLQAEQWQEAIAFAEAINLYQNGDGDDLYAVSIAFKLDGDFATAERYLKRAVILGGRDSRHLYELASVQYLRGNFEDSEENFLAALSTRPPAAARSEIYRFLRDIRADDNVRWNINILLGRDSNLNGSFPPTDAYNLGLRSNRRSAWYADVEPSLFVQRELSEGTSVWLRPSAPLRWTTDADYSTYGVRIAGGFNFSRGRDLVRPSVTWHYSDARALQSSRGWTARLAWRRQYGRFSGEPFLEHRYRRHEGDANRPRDREYGAALTYYLSPQLALGVTPSYTRLEEVTTLYDKARRRALSVSLRSWRGSWSFRYGFYVSRTRYEDLILPQFRNSALFLLTNSAAVLENLPKRADRRVRYSVTASNEGWNVGGFLPEVTISTEKVTSSDPTAARARETTVAIGFGRLF